jgi:hypothetical protein
MESFASKVKALGVPIREEDNKSRLGRFEEKLPKRLPQSFASFLSRYSFPVFDVGGISLFGWDSNSNAYTEEASAAKGSLSELLLPAGYVQIGRLDTGDFDTVCFDLNETIRTASIESYRSITRTFSAIGEFGFQLNYGPLSLNSSIACFLAPSLGCITKTRTCS